MLALEMKKKKLLSIPVDCHIAVPDIALPPIPLALTIELNIPFNFIVSENLKITRKYFYGVTNFQARTVLTRTFA